MQIIFNSQISARSDVDELVIALSSWKKTETTHTLREFYFCPKDRFESRSLLFQWVSSQFYSIEIILKIRIVRWLKFYKESEANRSFPPVFEIEIIS